MCFFFLKRVFHKTSKKIFFLIQGGHHGLRFYIWSYVPSTTQRANPVASFVSHCGRANGAIQAEQRSSWRSTAQRSREVMTTAATVHQSAWLLSRHSLDRAGGGEECYQPAGGGGRCYCFSSRAQTCWGHPVRPLLFLSPADEEDEEEDEVVLGISICTHMIVVIWWVVHMHTSW